MKSPSENFVVYKEVVKLNSSSKMLQCPACGRKFSATAIKSWELKPRGKLTIIVELFECPSCKVKFRRIIKP